MVDCTKWIKVYIYGDCGVLTQWLVDKFGVDPDDGTPLSGELTFHSRPLFPLEVVETVGGKTQYRVIPGRNDAIVMAAVKEEQAELIAEVQALEGITVYTNKVPEDMEDMYPEHTIMPLPRMCEG